MCVHTCVYTRTHASAHTHTGTNFDINILRYLFYLYSLATALYYNTAVKMGLILITRQIHSEEVFFGLSV